MSKEFNTEEYNKLCAEFMGYKFSQQYECFDEFYFEWNKESDGIWFKESHIVSDDTNSFDYYYKVDAGYLKYGGYHTFLRFDSDWNWIMEVVEKIDNERWGTGVRITSRSCNIVDNGRRDNWSLNMIRTVARVDNAETTKDAVVQAIWEFLQIHKSDSNE
jgi:hypothetical protein